MLLWLSDISKGNGEVLSATVLKLSVDASRDAWHLRVLLRNWDSAGTAGQAMADMGTGGGLEAYVTPASIILAIGETASLLVSLKASYDESYGTTFT